MAACCTPPFVRERLLEVLNGWLAEEGFARRSAADRRRSDARRRARRSLLRRGAARQRRAHSRRHCAVVLRRHRIRHARGSRHSGAAESAGRGAVRHGRRHVGADAGSRIRPDRRRARRVPLLLLRRAQERRARRRSSKISATNSEELSPMEVQLESERRSAGEVVPVSFETVITETGMLQLWCVARDGRRWKLEFNVREIADEQSASISEPPIPPSPGSTRPTRKTPAFPRSTSSISRSWSRPGRMEPRRTLPSFLYLEEGQPVGIYAREQGAIVPTRLVHSAKSWLSNPDVDRTAKILPWDAGEGGRVLSPVEVSARFLSTMREAWDNSGRFGPLTEQDVVLTVPASFDEEARELTVQAAHDAGLDQLTLLEEPAAAFYSWIANNFARSRKLLFDGQIVLICDVGGGTSDFSPDPRRARWRQDRFHPHRRRQASAAGRRQSRSHSGLARRNQTRQAAFHPAAQRPAPRSARRPKKSCSAIRIVKAWRSASSAAARP